MLMPLPSADATPTAGVSSPSGPVSTGTAGTGRSCANPSASAAQSCIISCSCRFPITAPVTTRMISRALSYVPGRHVISASFLTCQENPPGGRFSTASRGCSAGTPLPPDR